ncbi:MAG: glycosyltransferase family 4 protein [Actinobacteria bacterium]|nr:glycosyltransferase family 4 protein [Actinomycetota bacterium]
MRRAHRTVDRNVSRIRPFDDGSGGPHVLILVQNLPVPLDRRVWLECKALRQAGFEVSVVCPMGPDRVAYEELEGVHIHRYPPPPQAAGLPGFVSEVVYCWLATAWMALRIARRHRIDAIQACNPPDTYFALAAPFKLFGTRFVFDQHDLCPELADVRFSGTARRVARPLLELLERFTYRLADHVISTNGSFQGIALTRGSVDPVASTVVRSGPVASEMRRGDPHPDLRGGKRHLACYLGVMGPQDGVDLLLRGIAELVHRRGRTDCHFALLGFGDCLVDLRVEATELGIDPWVTFAGRADDRMISEYLSTADLGVAPDPSNGFNDLCTMNKVVEYMAFGVPVVCFDLPEHRVSAADSAVYVSDNDVEALAEAIDGLLGDEARRARMSRTARSRIEDGLCWERQAEAYVSIYNKLLRRPAADTETAAPEDVPTPKPSWSGRPDAA